MILSHNLRGLLNVSLWPLFAGKTAQPPRDFRWCDAGPETNSLVNNNRATHTAGRPGPSTVLRFTKQTQQKIGQQKNRNRIQTPTRIRIKNIYVSLIYPITRTATDFRVCDLDKLSTIELLTQSRANRGASSGRI